MKFFYFLFIAFLQIAAQSELYSFLQRFGYLESDQIPSNETLKLAIQEAQRIGAIYPSGIFDNQTQQLIQRQRCGLGDQEVVRSNLNVHHSDLSIAGSRISYKVENAARTMQEIEHVRRVVYDSASLWNRVSNVEIFESSSDQSDIKIEFEEFDSTLLGITSRNENKTQIKFNNNINWIYHSNSANEEVNLNQAMLHQLGHALGLHHSDHPKSIMYPYKNENYQLHEYDTTMIQRLYGPKNSQIAIKETATQIVTKQLSNQISTIQPVNYKPVTSRPSGLPIDLCNSQIDAAEIIDNQIFMFRHDKYWQIDPKDGKLTNRPRLIPEYWPELTNWPVDAVLEFNGNQLFFIGDQVLTFHNRRLKSTQNLTEFGFPEDLKQVRLAYKWIYGDVKHFVWNTTHYWKLNTQTMRVEVDYPRIISNIWNGLSGSLSAAFMWGKDLYFLDAGEIYKFDSFKMDVARGFPRRFSHIFEHCMPKAEALISNNSSTIYKVSFLFLFVHFLTFIVRSSFT